MPIVDGATPLAEQVEAAISAGADLVELRVDLIDDVAAVEAFLQTHDSGRIIVTLRSADEGGAWDGEDAEKIAILERLGLLLPGYIDCELALWERSANLRQKIGLVCDTEVDSASGSASRSDASDILRRKNQLILSVHDFNGMSALTARSDALLAAPGIAKIAVTPRDAGDSFQLLEWLRESSTRKRIIAIGMGDTGVCTRVLARKFGGWLSFAALEDGKSSAPGQVTITDLRDRFRWDEINADTRVFGVIGWPVAHSKSPQLHNAAMRAAGIEGVYLPLPIAPTYEAFAAFMNRVLATPTLGFDGFSVTIPHKEHASRWLAERQFSQTALCAACGAVNTLIRDGEEWRGENTDALGAIAALCAAQNEADARILKGKSVLILGAGGAARALAAGMKDAGADVIVCNRTAAKAAALANELGVRHQPWDQRGVIETDVVINCTSVGMTPDVDASPLPIAGLRRGMIVLDTVYTPEETKLLRDAKAAGCVAISGVEMFLRQAAAQFRLWHGRDVGVDALRAALV